MNCAGVILFGVPIDIFDLLAIRERAAWTFATGKASLNHGPRLGASRAHLPVGSCASAGATASAQKTISGARKARMVHESTHPRAA